MFTRLLLPLGILGLLAAPVLHAQPDRVPSFGPNGTHWPSLVPTPFMYDDNVPNTIVVDATWAAIRTAIESLTPAQVAAGALIQVRPGTLPGNGSGSGDTPVLKDVGSLDWTQRVTVAPRDGYGTVSMTGGVRFLRVDGVCFAGFVVGSVKFQGCSKSALAWTKCNGWLAGYGTSGRTTRLLEFVEVVQPNSMVSNGDASDFYSAGGNITNWRFDGCYAAPRFFEANYSGAKPHTDTLQFAGSGGGSYGNMEFRDSAYFSSNNCAIQTGSVSGLTIRHSYIVSGGTSLSRYPHLPGGATEATTNAINGGGSGYRAYDSVIIGGIALGTNANFVEVQNTRVNPAPAGFLNPTTGSWTHDASLNQNNPDMNEVCPVPDDAFLASIWADPGDPTRASTPTIFPAGGDFDEPQLVSLNSATSGAQIYYTLDGSEPTVSSTPYSGPFTIPSSTTVKAFAVAGGLDDSGVRSANFAILNRVAHPEISPPGGAYLDPPTVTLSSETDGASIYYTLDGSTPDAQSIAYSGPFPVTDNARLRVIALKDGKNPSEIVQSDFFVGGHLESSEAWGNLSLNSFTGHFLVEWESIPLGNQIDAVTGVGPDVAESYNDLACIVRFAPSGFIDCRNGGGYSADREVPYVAGQKYRFRLDVSIEDKTYDVVVFTEDGFYRVLADDYAFRLSQGGVSSLANLGFVALNGDSHSVFNVRSANLDSLSRPKAPAE